MTQGTRAEANEPEAERPLFSIVIPTFNYGQYIRRAIDSVLSQHGDDYELVVVDDGSTDDTERIVAEYGSRLRYFRQANRGVFLACWRGLDETTGKYLLFFDADDALVPGSLAALRRVLHRNPELGLAAGRHVNIGAAGRSESQPLPITADRRSNFRNFLLGRLEILTGASAIRREAVDFLRRYTGKLRTGLETACIAHTLWHFDAAAIREPLLEVHDHVGRLRDNLTEIRAAGTELVEVVFHRDILPQEANSYRALFHARLLRDRARSYHKKGFHREAAKHFQQAVRLDPLRSLADTRNLRRYLLSALRGQGGKAASEVRGIPNGKEGVIKVAGPGRREQDAALREDPIGFLLRCARLGDVVRLNVRDPAYVLSHPGDIAHVLIEQPLRYRKTGIERGFKELFGGGLLAIDGPEHMQLRRATQPLLHRARIDGRLQTLRDVWRNLQESWREGENVAVTSTVLEYARRASAHVMLGIADPQVVDAMYHEIQGAHLRSVRRMQSRVRLPNWVPTRRGWILGRHISELDRVVDALVAQAHREGPGDNVISQLAAVRNSRGEALSDRVLRDQALGLFLAGYEPTANALTWLFHCLAHHPEWQRKLQNEIAAKPAPTTTAELLGRPVASQVVSELLRIHPSPWLLVRRALAADSLPSGVRLERGRRVFISPLTVHRDPRWYEDPEAFRPERFADGGVNFRAAGVYFPFGLGPRNCIGEYLARVMIGAVLHEVLSRFSLEPLGKAEIAAESSNMFTAQPAEPIHVALRARPRLAAA